MSINFEELLFEMGEELGIDIEPDPMGGCLLVVEEKYNIQIQPDQMSDDHILLGSRIAELGPGKYRENVLRDALKSNFSIREKVGTLGYFQRDNMLMLFEYLPTRDITPKLFAEAILKFQAKIIDWVEALENEKTSPDDAFEKPRSTGSPMFGLKS